LARSFAWRRREKKKKKGEIISRAVLAAREEGKETSSPSQMINLRLYQRLPRRGKKRKEGKGPGHRFLAAMETKKGKHRERIVFSEGWAILEGGGEGKEEK